MLDTSEPLIDAVHALVHYLELLVHAVETYIYAVKTSVYGIETRIYPIKASVHARQHGHDVVERGFWIPFTLGHMPILHPGSRSPINSKGGYPAPPLSSLQLLCRSF